MNSSIQRPFKISVPDDVLVDLRARLDRVRWPDEVPDAAWRYGTSVAYMQELVAHWREKYDWRTWEAELNKLPEDMQPYIAFDYEQFGQFLDSVMNIVEGGDGVYVFGER